MATFQDPAVVHNPAAGSVAPAAWGDAVRDAIMFLHDPPTARVTKSAVQGIANAADDTVSWNTESYDTDAIHDNATNNSRLTCKTAGKYRIFACVAWVSNATGSRHAWLIVNGATGTHYAEDNRGASPLGRTCQSLYTEVQLAVNDYVDVRVHQTSGGSLNVDSATSHFGMTWVSA